MTTRARTRTACMHCRARPRRVGLRWRRRLVERRRHHRRRIEHRRPVHHEGRRGLEGGRRRGRHRRHLRHRRRVRALLRGRDGHLERVARDRRGGGGDLRGERRRVRRAPGRDRRADEHRQHRERLGDVPDRRAAQRDLEARTRRCRTGTRSTPRIPDVPLKLYGAGHRLGDVRLLHRRHQRRGGREPHRLLGERGRQRHRPGRLGRRGWPRLLRLLVLRGEPGQAEGARGRRRRRVRRAERRRGAGRLVHAALAAALHVREAQLARRTTRRSRSSSTFTLENADTIATEAQFVPLSQEQIDEQKQKLEDATA